MSNEETCTDDALEVGLHLDETMADSSSCFHCRKDLGGKRFVRHEGKLVCVDCHNKYCANSCAQCFRPISVDSKELGHKGRYWHEDCFRCAKCYTPLAKERFGTKDDTIMCLTCCSREDAPRCHGCYKIIPAGIESVKYKGNLWHEECFTCCSCRGPIGSQSFISKDKDIYCSSCYDKKFTKNCVSCNKAITSGGVNYQDQPWHGDCFVCSGCAEPLAGSSFTNHEDQLFCVNCYKNRVAKKCSGCNNAITGFGKGVNVVRFEDSSWHEYCFNCKGCSVNLPQKGFVLKGRDIFCTECGNKE
ncbi:four and a half LIM domains protein 1 isoform X1 [Oryzias melastigma]|uniref:Four and a half LIM domains protein 1 n=2 Tax=Oryzias melastigma TaxID=30732 RepID=A0A3B3BHY8_ORYME|nr:four and a half LIM domains protein 1 isoform X1 [Oryzias melastigma]